MKKFYAMSMNNSYKFYSFASKKMRDDAVKANPSRLVETTSRIAHRSVSCRIYDASKLPEGYEF